MKRHYCKFCGAKKNEENLIQIHYKLLKKSYWFCRHHTSNFADVTHVRTPERKPVFVELFSGSGHIAAAAQERGFDTVTVDIESKFNPDICINIENLGRQQLPGHVDVIWASIPCYCYSTMSLEHHWEKVSIGYRQYYYYPKTKEAIQALRILMKTIRLIKQMKPMFYFLENPRGALRHFSHLYFVPFRHTVSYADYGFDYYKPTDIWTNNPTFNPIQISTAVGQTFETTVKDLNGTFARSLVPPLLIEEVFNSIDFLTPTRIELSV